MLVVHVVPGAKRTEVAGLHGDSLKVRVAAPAVESKANEALAAFVADRLGLPQRAVRIVSGGKSREKRLAIEGLAASAVAAALSPAGR